MEKGELGDHEIVIKDYNFRDLKFQLTLTWPYCILILHFYL